MSKPWVLSGYFLDFPVYQKKKVFKVFAILNMFYSLLSERGDFVLI